MSAGLSGGTGAVRLLVAALAIALVGLGSAAMIAVLTEILSLGGARSTGRSLILFAALCIAVPLGRYVSTMLLVRLAEDNVFSLRLGLARRIIATPLDRLEDLGPSRLLVSLSDDVRSISEAKSSLPNLWMNIAIVVGSIGYLGWLSWRALACFLLLLVVGVVTYQIPFRRSLFHLQRSRASWDLVVERLRGLMFGTKELQLNERRSRSFLAEGLEPASEELRTNNLLANSVGAVAHSYGQALFFAAIGLLILTLPRLGIADPRVMTGYSLTILYLIGPLESVLGLLPMINRGRVALHAIQNLGLNLTLPAAALEDSPRAPWRSLEMNGVSFEYRTPDGSPGFSVGPFDFALTPGELLFVVGGNGSGKTTFAKLLVGLYVPVDGEIILDAERIEASTRESYRQLFSAIFADFFVFDRLFGIDSNAGDGAAGAWLRTLELDKKVDVLNGEFSTLALSQGQRKRLALAVACLEDRPIYLFDEWAADQDPHFRAAFYHSVLPDLKRRGRTVVAISHDDRYYHLADRIVRLESGQVEFDGPWDQYRRRFGEVLAPLVGVDKSEALAG